MAGRCARSDHGRVGRSLLQAGRLVVGLLVFVGAYTITNQLQAVNSKSLAGICQILLTWLAIVIHLTTLMTAPTSFTGLVLTFLLPGIAQAYWLLELWPATGALSHPLTAMCSAWLALLAGLPRR